MEEKQQILVLGLGNDLLTDDGIGPKLIAQLQKTHPHEQLHYQSAFVGGLDILEIIKDYDQVVFIDAIKTRGGVPGSLYLFSPDDFRETLHLSNLHDIKFLTAIELGRKLSYKIPSTIDIIAIEIVEDSVYNDQFSPEIEKLFSVIHLKIGTYLLDKMNCKDSIPDLKT